MPKNQTYYPGGMNFGPDQPSTDEINSRQSSLSNNSSSNPETQNEKALRNDNLSFITERLKQAGYNENTIANFIENYKILAPILKENPDISKQQLMERLKDEKVPDYIINLAINKRSEIDDYVRAELGVKPKDDTFRNPVLKALYLKSKGYSTSEVDQMARQDKGSQTASPYVGANVRLSPDQQKRINEHTIQDEVNRNLEKTKKQEEASRPLGTIPNISNSEISSETEHGPKWHQEARKGILEHQIEKINRGPEVYEGQRLANKSPKELHGRRLNEELNPSLTKNRKILNEVQGKLRKGSEETRSQKAASPFLETAKKDLTGYHKELYGEIENEYEQSLWDQAQRNWEEKVAPAIKQRYLTPGVRGHGFIAKEVGDAAEKMARGVTEATIAHRAQNRAQSIQAAAGEKESAIKGANIAGMHANQDAKHNIEATQLLHDANTADELKKRAHAEQQRSFGKEDTEQRQKELDIDHEKFKEVKNEQKDALAAAHNMTTAYPTSSTTTSAPPRPVRPEDTMQNTAGSLMTGLGAHFLSKKKGGSIRSKKGNLIKSKHLSPSTKAKFLVMINKHKKLAEGGSINPDLVQDAVFDGTDAGTELSRQNRRKVLEQAKENYSNQKSPYAEGGAVNPIAQGAAMAKDLVQRDKALQEQEMQLREQIMAERQRTFGPQLEEKESPIKGALDAAMAAAAASENNDWLARGAKAYTGATENINAKKVQKKAEEKEHRNEMAEMAKQFHAERKSDRAHELAEKGHGLKEKALVETSRLHNAMIGHYGAHNELLKAQAEKIKHEQVNPSNKAMTADQRRSKKEALENIKTGLKMNRDISTARELISKVSTGPTRGFISRIPVIGKSLASSTGKGSLAEYQNVDTLGNNIFLGAHQSLKNIPRSTEFANIIRESKFSADKDPEANKFALDLNENVGKDSLETGREQLADLGYSPEEIENIIRKYQHNESISSNVQYMPSHKNDEAAQYARYQHLKKKAGG